MLMTDVEEQQIIFDTIEKGDLRELIPMLSGKYTAKTILPDVYALGNTCTRKPSLLIVAASFGKIDIMEWLLQNGADPNFCDKRNRCPLHFAAMQGDMAAMQLLLMVKANVNKSDWDGCTPLHYCAACGFLQGAAALLDAGAQIDAQTRTLETPLIVALEGNQNELVNFFVQAHCNVELIAMQRRTPLFFAYDEETATVLINAGANIRQTDEDGETPLHMAAQRGFYEVAKVLIQHGADVNATDNAKQTPLHIVAENGQAEVCELLLQNNGDLKALDSARRSPEMLARRNENYAILELISKYRPVGDDEDTPLLSFKPFAGIMHTSKPPKVEIDISSANVGSMNFDIEPQ